MFDKTPESKVDAETKEYYLTGKTVWVGVFQESMGMEDNGDLLGIAVMAAFFLVFRTLQVICLKYLNNVAH